MSKDIRKEFSDVIYPTMVIRTQAETIELQEKEIERLNKILNDIDTYIHLWKIDDIGEKTMLILNDILLIKNGMKDEVIRLKEVIKSE